MKVQGIVALAVVAVAIAACGGGGGGGAAPSGSIAVLPTAAGNAPAGANPTPTPSSAALPAGYAVDNVSITMAKGTYSTTSVRRVQTVGTGTESIVFTLLQQNGSTVTGTAQVFGLVQTSPGCTVNATTGALSCVLPVGAPIGQDIFLAQTYDTSNGTGNLTGSGVVALSVGQNTTNTASIVLNAQVASVYVVAGGSFLGNTSDFNNDNAKGRSRGAQAARRVPTLIAQPTISSLPVFVVATDSSGNTILNPSAYNAPLYLQLGFDYYNGNIECCGEEPATPDVTLTVTYGPSDPSPCVAGGTATASNYYSSFPLCSPSDLVTASLSPTGGSNPSETAYIFGYISPASLVPPPNPTPLPIVTPSGNSFTFFSVGYPPPACPPGQNCLPVNVQ